MKVDCVHQEMIYLVNLVLVLHDMCIGCIDEEVFFKRMVGCKKTMYCLRFPVHTADIIAIQSYSIVRLSCCCLSLFKNWTSNERCFQSCTDQYFWATQSQVAVFSRHTLSSRYSVMQ